MILDDIKIIPAARKDWAVAANGRVLCTCTHKQDAEIIANGLEAINQNVDLIDHNFLLQDTLEQVTQGKAIGLIVRKLLPGWK
jgi:hypothetical protein